MHEKNLEVAYLLDYYGGMLTEKQREVVDLYYNEDLSLAEISEHAGITRQGVRDSIKRGEAQLLEMEQKLGLMARIRAMEQALEDVVSLSEELERYAADNVYVKPLADLSRRVREAVDSALGEREALIIRLRYGLDGAAPLTQRETAEKCGISRSYVSRIEKRALEKLREALEGN